MSLRSREDQLSDPEGLAGTDEDRRPCDWKPTPPGGVGDERGRMSRRRNPLWRNKRHGSRGGPLNFPDWEEGGRRSFPVAKDRGERWAASFPWISDGNCHVRGDAGENRLDSEESADDGPTGHLRRRNLVTVGDDPERGNEPDAGGSYGLEGRPCRSNAEDEASIPPTRCHAEKRKQKDKKPVSLHTPAYSSLSDCRIQAASYVLTANPLPNQPYIPLTCCVLPPGLPVLTELLFPYIPLTS